MNTSQVFKVTLFAEVNFLSLSLLENLLSKKCFVQIVAIDIKSWQKATENISNTSKFSIENFKSFEKNLPYVVIVAGYNNDNPYESINFIFENSDLGKSKNLIILPFEKYAEPDNVNVPENIAVIYLGDLLGPRIDAVEDLYITNVLQRALLENAISVSVGDVLYPMFVGDAVKKISGWMLSFGPYGKEVFLLGDQMSVSEFWKLVAESIPGTKIVFNHGKNRRSVPQGKIIETITSNLKIALRETTPWLLSDKTSKKHDAKRPANSRKSVIKIKYPRYTKPAIIVLLVALLLPVFVTLAGAGVAYASYRQFLAGENDSSQNLLLVSKTISTIGGGLSKPFSVVPIIGPFYNETSFASTLLVRLSDLGIDSLPVVQSGSDLVNNVLGNKIYDPSQDAGIMKIGLGKIYRDISILQIDTNSASEKVYLAKLLQKKIDFEKFKKLSSEGENLAAKLPDILGKEKSRTYLILFQNNMELRPTGGFIGSFGLLTLDGGRISNLAVNDVYSADGQLNGHVEPPTPIKDYLGEANWWFRDSNWDPDFPTSAKRAEWFLDKEMGKEVDGVVAIDLAPIKSFLKYSGPVFLPDFNLNISSENLYQKTQDEVQQNFFPGSRKKSSFLTALSRGLLSDLSNLSYKSRLGVLLSVYESLQGRNIQVFLHDNSVQQTLSNLDWDGSVSSPKCGDACYADLVGDVEANLGVNKANYFIERRMDYFVNSTSGRIDRQMVITLKNSASPSLGEAGRYKTYLRMLVNSDTDQASAVSVNGQSAQKMSLDTSELKGHKELGMLVEVLPGQTKKIDISWSSPLSGEYATYGLYLRKQAGVGSDAFSLTVDGATIYNSLLASDYFVRLPIK